MYTVYKHAAPNGKVYIGITMQNPEKRWQNGNHYKGNKHFYRAILKYGWENIRHEIVANGLTKEQACAKEIELIAKYDSTNSRYGYNNSTGGECGAAGVHPSAETRRKISEANKGKYVSPETRRKISEARKGRPSPWKGKHLSADTRRKLSEARKGANNPNYGKHRSAGTRRKISEANKGRHYSAETRQKMSESLKRAYLNNPELRQKLSESQKGRIPWNKGKHQSDETRKKIGEANAKAVICVETGILYSSTTEAGKSIGVTATAISSVLHGKSKTSGGYHWEYAD